MIVARTDDAIWLTRQTVHMEHVARIAEAWGCDEVAAPLLGKPLMLAAACHDEGWRSWEERPRLDPETGFPLAHSRVPSADQTRFLPAGIDRLEAVDPAAAFLASLHCTGLFLGRYGLMAGEHVPARDALEPHVRRFVAVEEERQARLRPTLDADDDLLWDAYRQLEAWDRLSVILCARRARGSLGPVPGAAGRDPALIRVERRGRDVWELTPFPFRGPVSVPVESYRLPNRPFASEADFWEYLDAARPEAVELVLRGA